MKKTAIIINRRENKYDIEAGCFDIEKSRIKLIDRFHSLADHLTFDAIFHGLQVKEFSKTKTVVGINIDDLFFVSIMIPKISASESKKAINLDLIKYYGSDYKEKFIISEKIIPFNKEINEYYFAMIKKEKYRNLLRFLEEAGLNIERIVCQKMMLKQYLLDKIPIKKDETVLFINMTKSITDLIMIKNERVTVGFSYPVGMKDLDETIAVVKEISQEEARKERKERKNRRLRGFMAKTFGKAVLFIKQMGYGIMDLTTVYVNSEDGSGDVLAAFLSGRLNLPVIKLDDSPENCFSLAACLTEPGKNDLVLPLRIKV